MIFRLHALAGLAGIAAITVGFRLHASHAQPVSPPPAPESTTLKWTDESDLITILDTASNKLLVARAVIARCDDPTAGLTVSERQDGYNIAGHTLYRHHEMQDALSAFTKITQLDPAHLNIYDLADAWRMVGQINRKLPDYEAAFLAYKASFDVNQSAPDPIAAEYGSAYVLPFLIDSAFYAGRFTDVLSYVDLAMADYTTGTMPHLPRMVEMGGDAALRQGDTQLAVEYYEDFLRLYPDYEADPAYSTALRIKVKVLKAKGIDVYDDCTAAAMKAGFELFTDPAYDDMLLRYSIGDSIAHCMRQDGQEWTALEFRKLLVAEVDEDLASPETSSHAFYKDQLEQLQVGFLYNAARVAIDLNRDLDEALLMIKRIEAEFDGVDPYYQGLAADLAHMADPTP